MLGRIFALFCLCGTIGGIALGNTAALSQSILDSATQAVTLSVGLLGAMCLWCGVLRVLRDAGVTAFLSRKLSFLLGRIFPTAWQTGHGKEEIAASFVANLLGIGNAATPLALCAMKEMEKDNPHTGRATDDMVTFTVWNTAPVSILPTTLLALRSAAHSQNPAEILPLVWVCSLSSACVAVLLARGLRHLWKR